jgi:hypothetical protein
VWCVAIALMMALGAAPSLSLAQAGLDPVGSKQAEGPRFFLLGFLQEGETKPGILGWEGLVFLVREGDTILGTYRVERLGDDVAILRDGDREIQASFRPKQPDMARPQSAPYDAMAASDQGLPVPHPTSQGLVPAGGGGPFDPSTTGPTTGVGLSPASPRGMASPSGTVPQGQQEENPFAKALRERAQGASPSGSSQDNPFQRAMQQGSSPPSSGDNPFLRAIRERSSAPTSSQDNPFQRALRERGY